MKFDKYKCLKLLQDRKNFLSEGKLLPDYDKSKNDELIRYLSMVEDQIFWESRKKYLHILDLFVSKKINLDNFFTQFSVLRGSNLKSYRMLKNKLEEEASGILTQLNRIDFHLNPESSEFTTIISNLNSWIDLCDPDIKINLE